MSSEPIDLAQESAQYDDDPVVKDTMVRVTQLNSSLDTMRKQGYDSAYVDQYRREQLDALMVNHYRMARQAQEQAEQEKAKAVDRWKIDRDKRPDHNLLDFQRNQIEIDAMDKKDLVAEANRYILGEEQSYERLSLIAGGLKNEAPAEYKALKEEMKKRRADEPWLKDERIANLDYYARKYETEFGRLHYRIGPQRNQMQEARIETMVK